MIGSINASQLRKSFRIKPMIVKLLEKDQSPSDGMATNMSMMLMKQMEATHKSMDKRAF